MKEFIEKLIGRLEEQLMQASKDMQISEVYEDVQAYGGKYLAFDKALNIVNQLAEEYSVSAKKAHTGGWIPCSERLPDKLEPVNITWVNRKPEPYYAHIKDIPFVATAFYHNGKWWWFSNVCEDYLEEYGRSDCDVVDKDIEIIAWQPLPAPYTPHEEGRCK